MSIFKEETQTSDFLQAFCISSYLRQQNHNKILLTYLLVDQGMPEIAKIESVECVFRNVYNFVKRLLLLNLEGTRDGAFHITILLQFNLVFQFFASRTLFILAAFQIIPFQEISKFSSLNMIDCLLCSTIQPQTTCVWSHVQ